MKFLSGDEKVRHQGMAQLAFSRRLPQRIWWRLEGVTKVDCALFTSNSVIFVEGKRTELGASKKVEWYPFRNQVLRNLDCAAESAYSLQVPYYFCLLIVEGKLCPPGSVRRDAINAILSPEIVERSLPHIVAQERQNMLACYRGFTTWEEIAERLALDYGT